MYLLAALIFLTVTAMFIAPRLGLLLSASAATLLAYEYSTARYVLFGVIAFNVFIVLLLLSVSLISSLKRGTQSPTFEAPAVRESGNADSARVSTTEQRSPPSDS